MKEKFKIERNVCIGATAEDKEHEWFKGVSLKTPMCLIHKWENNMNSVERWWKDYIHNRNNWTMILIDTQVLHHSDDVIIECEPLNKHNLIRFSPISFPIHPNTHFMLNHQFSRQQINVFTSSLQSAQNGKKVLYSIFNLRKD